MSRIPDLTLDAGIPANVAAERTILGAILLDNAAFAEAAEHLAPDDFSLDSHRRIFLRMTDLMRERHAVDIVTLPNCLALHKEVESIGGVAYLAGLTEGLPRQPVIGEYIRIVRDKSLLRKIMAVCTAAIARATDQGESALEVLSALQGQCEDISLSGVASDQLESIGEYLARNDIFAERPWGIRTGIDAYDELTFGLQPGELTVMAGRTSMGKTAFASTLAANVGRAGKFVAVFINEQGKPSFLGRMLCGVASAPFNDYRRGNLGMIDHDYVERARDRFRMLPIFWDQRSSMSIVSIRTKALRLKRSGELDLVIVDQLSRVSGEGIYVKGMRSDEVIGEKVSALKGLAVDLNVPVVLMHQVGRGALKNAEKRPDLGDLAESGKIEQHADNVTFFHRPRYFDRTCDAPDELILAKCRDGETGTVECEFVPQFCVWRNRTMRR